MFGLFRRALTVAAVLGCAVSGSLAMTSSQASAGALPPAGTCQGNVQVVDAATGTSLGYLSTVLDSEYQAYTYTTTTANYLTVSFAPGVQQNITTIGGPAAPNNHLIVQHASYTTQYLNGTTIGVALLAGGSTTAPGSLPSATGTSTYQVPSANYPIESAVWNTTSSTLVPTWINPDGSAGVAVLADESSPYWNHLELISDLTDLERENAGTDLHYQTVRLKFVGTCNLVNPNVITFAQPSSPAVWGGAATLSASSSYGLPVSFSVDPSSTRDACRISGSTVTYTAPGTCVIDADQPGTDLIPAASTVQRTVLVGAVACDHTLTGNLSSVNVTSGTTCLVNASVNGAVTVARGAGLDVENSTVSGSISASTPNGIRVCGSRTGSISVTGATGPVVVGGAGDYCAGNVVSGSIVADGDRSGTVIQDNTVSGSVTAVNDTGTGPHGEPPVAVSGNHH